MAKSSDTHELTPEQTTRCKRQIGLATAAAVIVAALLWIVAVRLGLTSLCSADAWQTEIARASIFAVRSAPFDMFKSACVIVLCAAARIPSLGLPALRHCRYFQACS